MKLWWLTNTARLAAERRRVEVLAHEASWLSLERWRFHDFNLAAEGEILAKGHRYKVRLVYPDQFPEVPAWVEPQEDVRLTQHQYGKGTLCLELRPDNWVSSATGADVLLSAFHLLETEDPLGQAAGQAPSAHAVGEIQNYDWGADPVLIGAGCAARLNAGTASEVNALRFLMSDNVTPTLIHDAQDRSSKRRPPSTDLRSWLCEVPVYLAAGTPPTDAVDRDALIAAGNFDEEARSAIGISTAAVVLFVGDPLVVFHLGPEGTVLRRRVLVLPDEGGARSGRATHVEGKLVAVVGAGSIGSKLAECLVRSGIARLRLVDGDVMLPANLERHSLDWRDVGSRKVHALKRRLMAIVPGIDVEVTAENLDWQRSSKSHAWQVEAIANADVIVDATGDPATALFLGAIANANSRAFVSAEVFEGGIGGLVASCLPERDPPYADARRPFSPGATRKA